MKTLARNTVSCRCGHALDRDLHGSAADITSAAARIAQHLCRQCNLSGWSANHTIGRSRADARRLLDDADEFDCAWADALDSLRPVNGGAVGPVRIYAGPPESRSIIVESSHAAVQIAVKRGRAKVVVACLNDALAEVMTGLDIELFVNID